MTVFFVFYSDIIIEKVYIVMSLILPINAIYYTINGDYVNVMKMYIP